MTKNDLAWYRSLKKNHKRDQKIKIFKEIQENITFIKQEDDREETQKLNEKNYWKLKIFISVVLRDICNFK